MAKKNQVTEAKIASLKEEIEKLRNENHNLKRKVKRMEERKAAEKAERLEAQAQRMRRTEEVTMGSMDEIKKKLMDAGLNVPSYVTVRDWVLKAGLDSYAHRCKNLPVDEAYAIVMDESITIAEHKILLTLKTPAQHPGQPLAPSDVEVIDIHVASSHNSSDIADAVERITETAGHAPGYAVTDNGTSLAKGLRDAGLDGHRDISHTFGTFLKAVYDRDEQYVSLTKAIGNARHYALTDVDYLMPCNMRALARYMNVFGWIHWAKNMMEASDKLSSKERKSDNRMYGVTSLVMILPLHTRLSTLESARIFDFKGCLERSHSADLKVWSRQNLPENLAAKRARILRNAA